MKLNEEQLRFFYHEVLGEIGWCDEDEEAGTDPLAHVLGEIRKMRKEIEKVKAAPKCTCKDDNHASWCPC